MTSEGDSTGTGGAAVLVGTQRQDGRETPGKADAGTADRAARTWWRWWVFCPLFYLAVTRLFSGQPFFVITEDACTFLQMGRTFPRHHVFGDCLYLIHPPLFGWLIGLFALVLPVVAAGLLVNQLAWLGVWACIKRYAEQHGVGPFGIVVGLVYLGINWLAWWQGIEVSRFGLLVFGVGLALVVFEAYLRNPTTRRWGWALAANTFCLLVSDQAALVLPCQLVAWAFSRQWQSWRRIAVTMVLGAVVVMIWPAVRLVVYRTHDVYPAGISGMVEPVGDAGLMAVLQPNLLPHTAAHNRLNELGEMGLSAKKFERLRWTMSVLRQGSGGEWVVLAVMLLAFARHRATAGKLAIQCVILLFPAFVGHAWYGLPWLVPGCVLLGMGAEVLVGWKPTASSVAAGALGVVIVVYGLMRLSAMSPPGVPRAQLPPRFLYAKPATVLGDPSLRDAFAQLPPGGVMSTTDLTPALAWLTDRSVVALPFDPAELDALAKRYGVKYLVIDVGGLAPTGDAQRDRLTERDVERWVVDRPQEFPVIAQVTAEFQGRPAKQLLILKADGNAGR